MREIDGEVYFSMVEVGARLDVEPQTVKSYIERGRLKGVRDGKKYFVSETVLNRFIKSCEFWGGVKGNGGR